MGHVFESYMWNLRWERRQGTEFVPKIFSRIASPAPSETITGFYGFQMSPDQHAAICPMIDEMGQRYEEESQLEEADASPSHMRFRRNDPIGPLKR
ncbi:MAG TPA: hypothetical protein VFJ76_04210 [Solirubrobacterales bacterium]|nr:hypothetical protein [Solirubrobacterales bacterium]